MADEQPHGITDRTLRRIRSEFLQMPGLCLTLKQAQRLWDLDEETCAEAMRLLVETNFLCRAASDARDLPPGSSITFRRPQQAAAPLDHKAAA